MPGAVPGENSPKSPSRWAINNLNITSYECYTHDFTINCRHHPPDCRRENDDPDDPKQPEVESDGTRGDRANRKVGGTKILFKTLQRALPSSASNPQAAIWLWIACTADNVIFLVRDDFTEEGEGNAVVSFKQDASLLRLNKTLTQLEMKIKDSSEVVQLFLLLNTSRYEALTRYIPVKRNSGSR